MEMVFDKQKRGTLILVFFVGFYRKEKKASNIINQILVGFEEIYNMILDKRSFSEQEFYFWAVKFSKFSIKQKKSYLKR